MSGSDPESDFDPVNFMHGGILMEMLTFCTRRQRWSDNLG
jgi:hypothetical protein